MRRMRRLMPCRFMPCRRVPRRFVPHRGVMRRFMGPCFMALRLGALMPHRPARRMMPFRMMRCRMMVMRLRRLCLRPGQLLKCRGIHLHLRRCGRGDSDRRAERRETGRPFRNHHSARLPRAAGLLNARAFQALFGRLRRMPPPAPRRPSRAAAAGYTDCPPPRCRSHTPRRAARSHSRPPRAPAGSRRRHPSA